MYMMTLLSPEIRLVDNSEERSQMHFRYCQILQEEWLESPCVFSLIASYLLSFYCFQKPTSIIMALTNVSLVARGSLQLGLRDRQFAPWVSKSGKVYAAEDPSIQVMTNIFFTLLYEQDWIISYVRKLSFLLPAHNPAIDDIEDGLVDFNFYYNSGLWRHDYDLAKIARNITVFIRDTPHNFHTDPMWLKTYNQLMEDLSGWKSNLPTRMHDVGSTMNTAIPSRWKLEYSNHDIVQLVVTHAKFYGLQIFLHRAMFLHILGTGGNYEHVSVVKCVDAGRRIDHLLKMMLELDVDFENLPPFFSLFMFYGAAVLCMSTQIYGRSKGLVDTVNMCINYIEKCRYCPPFRAQNLRKWLADPMSGLHEFATAL
jgi:hypothetical protein